ncbi:MAG: hypothetical protein IJY46_07730 [Lentisphaeria bacterium]|nr:hypothetical protein [Lentisphaeria bacterium]
MSETTSTGYSIQFRDANGTPLYPIARASGVIMPNNQYLDLTDYAKRAELISELALVVSALPSADTADHRLIYCVPAEIGEGYTKYIPVNKGATDAPDWDWVDLGGSTITVDPDEPLPEGVYVTVEQVSAALAKKANSADVYLKTETYSKTEVDAAIALDVSYVSLGETEIEPPPGFLPEVPEDDENTEEDSETPEEEGE